MDALKLTRNLGWSMTRSRVFFGVGSIGRFGRISRLTMISSTMVETDIFVLLNKVRELAILFLVRLGGVLRLDLGKYLSPHLEESSLGRVERSISRI